jgi:hypothetical protein
MNDQHPPDWDPKSKEVLRDQRAAYDDMRRRCPVAHSEFLGLVPVPARGCARALHDHETVRRSSFPNSGQHEPQPV